MEDNAEPAEYVTVEEATRLLGVKRATLYAYVSRGVLRSYRQAVGRQRLYQRSEIEKLLQLRVDGDRGVVEPDDDTTVREVNLPGAETWVGDH
jgi:excisionase family DNA binding protein